MCLSSKQISEILLTLRDKGYSTQDLAVAIGVSRPTIYNWINEKTYPTQLHIRRILNISHPKISGVAQNISVKKIASPAKQRALDFG